MISLFSTVNDALRVITPCILLFIGAGLWAYVPHYRFTTAQRLKNGKLSETDARRAITFFRWSGPGMTALGVVLLLFACAGR
jgi:hypothetical protein